MLVTTTSKLDGKQVKEYRGVVFGQAVSGIDFVRDLGINLANMTGGRVAEYEQEIVSARADAIKEMMDKAQKIGANALIGVHVDFENITISQGSMLVVTAEGTAVVVSEGGE